MEESTETSSCIKKVSFRFSIKVLFRTRQSSLQRSPLLTCVHQLNDGPFRAWKHSHLGQPHPSNSRAGANYKRPGFEPQNPSYQRPVGRKAVPLLGWKLGCPSMSSLRVVVIAVRFILMHRCICTDVSEVIRTS